MLELQLEEMLKTLRQEFLRVLGDRFQTMLLYGSWARGEARPDSDIDVLVVVRGPLDYGSLLARTSHIVAALSLEHDVVISRAFVSQEQYDQEQSPFLLNVRRDGALI